MADSQSKKTRLTASARRLIHAAGYAQTTLADIAEAAEVPLGNVYYYFKTKDALAQAVIEQQRQEFEQLLEELNRLSDPHARLDGYLSMLLLQSESIAANGCPIGGICVELNKGGSPLAVEATNLLRSQLHWMSTQFQQMGRAEDATELAQYLLAQLQGTMLLTQVFKDPNLLTRQIANIKTWLEELT